MDTQNKTIKEEQAGHSATLGIQVELDLKQEFERWCQVWQKVVIG